MATDKLAVDSGGDPEKITNRDRLTKIDWLEKEAR
jgi:hypothetical protein